MKLFGKIAKRINNQTIKNRKKRMIFCNIVKSWTNDDWKKMAFSDEVSFELESSNRAYVRKHIGTRNKRKYCIKFKYNERRALICRGCIAADGTRILVSMNCTVNSEVYCDILENNYMKTFDDLILLQDSVKPKNCDIAVNILQIKI